MRSGKDGRPHSLEHPMHLSFSQPPSLPVLGIPGMAPQEPESAEFPMHPGDRVLFAEGILQGLEGTIAEVRPERCRVSVPASSLIIELHPSKLVTVKQVSG